LRSIVGFLQGFASGIRASSSYSTQTKSDRDYPNWHRIKRQNKCYKNHKPWWLRLKSIKTLKPESKGLSGI